MSAGDNLYGIDLASDAGCMRLPSGFSSVSGGFRHYSGNPTIALNDSIFHTSLAPGQTQRDTIASHTSDLQAAHDHHEHVQASGPRPPCACPGDASVSSRDRRRPSSRQHEKTQKAEDDPADAMAYEMYETTLLNEVEDAMGDVDTAPPHTTGVPP